MILGSPAKADSITTKELDCLATNVYFEARNEHYPGRIAVTHVVLNRVFDKRWPNNICDVVYQAKTDSRGFPLRHKCQFSWYCDGLSDEIKDQKLYEDLYLEAWIAYKMYSDGYDITQKATHYHTVAVNPYWSKKFERLSRIGYHIFYR